MDNKIDMNQILEDIQQIVELREYSNLPVIFDDINLRLSDLNAEYDENSFFDNIHNMNNSYCVQAYRNIKSRCGIVGKIILFVKKILRKSIKFYIEPIVTDQNLFNVNVVGAINEIRNYIVDAKKNDISLEISKLDLKWNKNIRKPLESTVKTQQDIHIKMIYISNKLNEIIKECETQRNENLYLKNRVELLSVNNKILEKEIDLLKCKMGG